MPGEKQQFLFDQSRADLVQTFFRKFLRHSKGQWAGKPFELLPWQWEKVVRPLFGWVRADGTRRYRKAYVEIPKKNGKALSLDTPIATPGGWTTIGEIHAGEKVFDENGQPCNVVAVGPIEYDRPCYQLRFSDGEVITADAEHEWVVDCYRNGLKRTGRGEKSSYEQRHIRTTKEIAENLLVSNANIRTCNFRIKVAGPLDCLRADLPVAPYTLGAWLGDGTSANANLTCSDDDTQILAEIAAEGVSVGPGRCKKGKASRHTLGSNGRGIARRRSLQAKLRRLGLLQNKHIPAKYLRASIAQRLSLLQGLMDTDGCVCLTGPKAIPRCEYTSVSKRLAVDVADLICTLGYKPTICEGRAKLYGRDVGPKYRVCFTAYKERPVFRLARKLQRLASENDRAPRSKYRQIVEAIKVAAVPVRCIQVSSPSGCFLAGRNLIATHNSTLCAGLALYLLIGDSEAGAEVYSAACDHDQAGIIFNEAASMVEQSPALKDHVEIIRSQKRLVFHRTRSFYKALSADVPTKEGLNIHGLVFDELHAQPNRDLWDCLQYGGASRRQPLQIAITTAGWDRHSICWEQHRYAEQVLSGVIDDPSFFAFIAGAAEGDEWTSPETWRKANPSLGSIVTEEEMAAACAEAQASPLKENSFKRYRLNLWTEQDVRWMPMAAWDACAGPIDRASLAGRECIAGLDLSTTIDISALVLIFRGENGYDILPYFWVPAENARERERKDKVPYLQWAKEGLIELTPGNVIDYGYIRRRVNELTDEFDVREIAADPYNARHLLTELGEDGLTVLEVRQGYLSMSPAMKELERVVLEGRFRHGGNPVMRWMASNVAAATDPAGNIKPDKGRSTEKIDGISALVTGLSRWICRPQNAGRSVYEDRGIIALNIGL